MKLLVVSQYFWPEGFRINEVVLSLLERGVQVDILTGKPNYPDGKIFPGYSSRGCAIESWSGATLYRLPIFARGKHSAWRLALNYLSFIVSGLILGPLILRKHHYDVIFVYGLSPIFSAIPAIFIGWLRNKKVVVWVQDLWPESLSATGYVKNKFVLKLVGYVVNWIYMHSDILLVQSRAFIDEVSARAPGKKIIYYPNSVDSIFLETGLEPTDPIAIKELENCFSVVFAGNVGAAQAVEVMIDAAKKLKNMPEIQFIVFGSGSKWDWMLNQMKIHNLTNLHLLGHFPISVMPGLLRKAGALLVSLADEPIFSLTVPNKLQAYLAVGRPIIASLNGEGAKIVRESGAGLSVKAGDGNALAETIKELYAMSEDARAQLGINGQDYYRDHFNHDQLIEELLEHLKGCLNIKLDVI